MAEFNRQKMRGCIKKEVSKCKKCKKEMGNFK